MFLTGGSKKIAWNVMSKKRGPKKEQGEKKPTNHHRLHAALLMVLENAHKKQQPGVELQK